MKFGGVVSGVAIAVVFAVLVSLCRAVDVIGAQEQLNQAQTLSNVKQLALGLLMYANDYDDRLPYPRTTAQVAGVIYPYLKSRELWKTQNPNKSKILFNMCIGGVEITKVPRPSLTPTLYEDKPWPDGRRAVGFVDGHAKLVDKADWHGMQTFLHLHLKRNAKPFPPNYNPMKGMGSG